MGSFSVIHLAILAVPLLLVGGAVVVAVVLLSRNSGK